MDFYEVLGVLPSATAEEIKKAYRRKSLEYHPDRNPGIFESDENFKIINQAYSVLCDPEQRLRYDAEKSFSSRFTRWQVPSDLTLGLSIPMVQAYLGGTERLTYMRTIMSSGGPVTSVVSVEVKIPARSKQGEVICIRDAGNIVPISRKPKGDLYVILNYPWEENGVTIDSYGNLYGSIFAPLVLGLRSETITYVPFVDSAEKFPIQLDINLGQGHVYCLDGHGMGGADFFVKVFYEIPTNMKMEDRVAVAKILDNYARRSKS